MSGGDRELRGGFFGPPSMRRDWERQVDTPVGAECMWCDEKIREGDTGSINLAGQVTHYECGLRAMVGSVAHQARMCSCYGGTMDEDPPGMTRHQAARAATLYFLMHRR